MSDYGLCLMTDSDDVKFKLLTGKSSNYPEKCSVEYFSG